MLSICMATYNGAQYIKEQLNSIIAQLEEGDELVICDDSSTDDTCEIIKSFSDSRIKLHNNISRLGHVKNFEKAISLSKNEVIVLSDQDDVWDENKLAVIRDTFVNDKELMLYHHGITTIDETGNILDTDFNKLDLRVNSLFKLKKISMLFFKQYYFGCCMSFRKKLNTQILPFPRFTYAHDHWISIAANIKGKSFCDNNSLIYYRQHSSNVTPKGGLNIISKVRVRMLQVALILIAFKRKCYVQK